MKKMLLLLSAVLFLAACHKNALPLSNDASLVERILQQHLTAQDKGSEDLSTLQSGKLSNGHTFYRLALGHEQVALEVDQAGKLVSGAIFQVSGSIDAIKGHQRFNGQFRRSDLQRVNVVHYSIENGTATALHSFSGVTTNSLGVHVNYVECSDCSLPEVIVGASYTSGGGIDWGAWLSLLSLFNMGGPGDYIPVDWGSGGGGSGNNPAPVIYLDTERPENKDKIDPKKYTDCFGTIPDGSTTLYTLTISADIPVDGHPEIFYDWDTYSPGHAFIELSKSTPYGSVIQDLGFYPTSAKKFVLLDNSEASTTSKMVDNGGHEYNARYTISVTAAQFQAAINQIASSSSRMYNVGLYNCTDFALEVFNAAGGNLSIPRYPIPGFEVTGGSNTPQGLFNQIQSMKNNGVAGTTTTAGKEYAGASKGPCN